ncbi:MAG: hypothetical protein ACTSQJ_02835 [Promethearchaeota archaeon]
MTDENNKKRKRPTLYKKNGTGKDEDVLKKLKEVRQNLQESLDEKPTAAPETPAGPRTTRKRGERRLYKKPEIEAPKPVKKRAEVQISKKRLAQVQRRVKAKIEATKGISKKKKALIIIWMVIMTIPLVFLSSIVAVTLEFNFEGFGLTYNENKPGTIILSFPARNPSFVPARINQFEIELYTEDGEYIGKAYNNDELIINPYQTERLYVTLAFEEDTGGKWMRDWLSEMKLKLNIGSITYSGIRVDTEFLPQIEVDTEPMLRDMITGLLDIEELVQGINFGDLLGGEESTPTTSDGTIHFDPYTQAKKASLIPRLSQFGGEDDDLTANVSFSMFENVEKFDFGLTSTINLESFVSPEDLGGIVLGPIELNNLDVQLKVSTSYQYEDSTDIEKDDNWFEHYDYSIAKLYSTDVNKIYIGDRKHRDSKIALNLTIFKDNPDLLRTNGNGMKYHPSQDITSWDPDDKTDPSSLYHFLKGTGNFDQYNPAWQDFPTWYFLYNILGRGALDCGISIENVDINIFGLDIKDLSISMSILPPLYLDEGVLDPDNFLRVAPDYGFAGIMKHFILGITEGPARGLLSLPEQSQVLGEEKDIDTLLTDFVSMIDFPEINFDSINEDLGNKLSIELPIGINNTLLDFYLGFENMRVSIASEINEVKREFMTLSLKGNNSEIVYISGINPENITTVIVNITINTNYTVVPFAVKFLKQLIENFTLDGIIMASFDKLILYKENYTYGHFDIAIPIVMDMESMVIDLVKQMVPGIINGLLDTGTEENSTGQGMNPFSPLMMGLGLAQMPALVSLLGNAPKLQQFASQDTTENETDAISELINGLINDIIGSLTGGLLGSEMEFTLGLEVDVNVGEYTKFNIRLDDFYIEEFFITIGLGTTDLRIQSINKNTGKWEDLVGLQVDDYFEIKSGKYEDIAITLTIYETEALCMFINDFITEFFNISLYNTVDLRIKGTTTANVSGIYIPDVDIDFALEDLDTELNGTAIIGDVFNMIYDIELDQNQGQPELLDLFAGPLSNIPIVSQGIDIDSLFLMGEISIEEISETLFTNNTDGEGIIKLSMKVVNYMMSVNIEKAKITVYDYHPVKNKSIATKILEVSIDDGPNGLPFRTNAVINVSITIYKSDATRIYLQNLINTLSLSGFLNVSAALDVFGCHIELKPTYLPAINLTKLPIELSSVFASILPITAPFMNLMGPRVSQDINMDSIFENVLKFSIGKIKIGQFNKVGPLDYTKSILNVDVDLWLQTMFNMSINGLKIQLLDGELYNALYVNGGHKFLDVVKEASIAELSLVQNAVHFNSCIPYSVGPNGYPIKDPEKPYIYNRSICYKDVNDTQWTCENVTFELDKNKLPGPTGVNATTFNETGFTNVDYLYLALPTLNNLSLRVKLFNKSHGTWETKYPRKYWKALGGPYFPAQKYGKEYGGYPDHYYVYHKYYAPLVNLVQKGLGLLDETGIAADSDAISELIQGIAIAGMVNVTMFSMDLTIDFNNPELNALIEPISGLFLETTNLAIKNYITQLTNPIASLQHPRERMMTELMMADGIEDIFGDLMDVSNIPLDINDIITGISFPGIADRTDHAYSTQTENQNGDSRCWDGHAKWGDQDEYKLDPSRRSDFYWDLDTPGYIGGLTDPYFTGETGSQLDYQYPNRGGVPFTPKEQFYKDDAYEWFKTVVDTWATDRGVFNPYFETHYTENGEYQKGDKIEDPKEWPLVYDKGAYGGRIRTAVINLHTGLLLKFPVGVLSLKLGLWIEDPYSPCQYMPFGYAWVNNSVYAMQIEDILKDPYVIKSLDKFLEPGGSGLTYAYINNTFHTTGRLGADQDEIDAAVMAICQAGVNGSRTASTPGYQIDEYGNMKKKGWVLNFNVRMFEGVGSYEFFWQMIAGGDFNIHFLAQGNVNISIFGYEFYNLFVPYDIAQLGDASRFQAKCDRYQATSGGGGGYGNWGIPGFNGSLTQQEYEEDTTFWPHYLLQGKTLEFAISLPLDAILDFESFLDFGDLLSNLGSIGLSDGKIVVDVELPIANPVPLVLWITNVYIEVWLGTGSGPGWNQIDWAAKIWIISLQNIPLIDLLQQGHSGDPYDFRYNSYYNWFTPHQVVLRVQAQIPLDIDLLIILLSAIFGGTAWLGINTLEIDTVMPATLHYELPLVIDLGDISEPMPLTLF